MNLRVVEQAWRRGWMRSVGALSSGARVAVPPDWDARHWSVLFMRAQGIGDLILATGVLRAISQSHSTISIDVLTTPVAAPVLENNPYVRSVHLLTRTLGNYGELARVLSGMHYDVVIDGKITRGASFIRSPVLTMALRAPYRIGVGGGNHGLVFNICVRAFDRTTTHMVDGSAALAAPFGVDVDSANFRPEIFLTRAEQDKARAVWAAAAAAHETSGSRWLVNVSAGAALRRWPDDRWTALIAHLRRQRPDATIAVIGVDAERQSVERVAHDSGSVAVATPNLRDALALVGTSQRVITCDTSITHAASAFAIPTMLMIQRGLDQWRSWRTPGEVLCWTGATVSAVDVATACASLDRFATNFP